MSDRGQQHTIEVHCKCTEPTTWSSMQHMMHSANTVIKSHCQRSRLTRMHHFLRNAMGLASSEAKSIRPTNVTVKMANIVMASIMIFFYICFIPVINSDRARIAWLTSYSIGIRFHQESGLSKHATEKLHHLLREQLQRLAMPSCSIREMYHWRRNNWEQQFIIVHRIHFSHATSALTPHAKGGISVLP